MSDALFEFDQGPASWAHISLDGTWRYELGRRWADGPLMGFIMLNPSTADHQVDDRTIRRLKGFAQREGAAGIRVVNLFAYRATKPRDMAAANSAGIDVVGIENDEWTQRLLDDRFGVKPIVAAWGALNLPIELSRIAGRRAKWIAEVGAGRLYRFHDPSKHVLCPHPLYLKGTTPLVGL